jgi:hypothetical protein
MECGLRTGARVFWELFFVRENGRVGDIKHAGHAAVVGFDFENLRARRVSRESGGCSRSSRHATSTNALGIVAYGHPCFHGERREGR